MLVALLAPMIAMPLPAVDQADSVIAQALTGTPVTADEPAPSRNHFGKRARGSLVGLFRDDDYPVAAQRMGEEGSVSVMLTIGQTGKVVHCAILQSAGPRLDEATCRILVDRAQFTPARDRRGRPTTDSYRQTIRWVLPQRDALPDLFTAPPIAFAASRSEVRMAMSRDGTLARCEGDDGAKAQGPDYCGVIAPVARDALSLAPPSSPDPVEMLVSTTIATDAAPANDGAFSADRQAPRRRRGTRARLRVASLCARARAVTFEAGAGGRVAWMTQAVRFGAGR